MYLFFADQYFYDTHVELRERSSGTVHVRISDQVYSMLDELKIVQRAASSARRKILSTLPRRIRSRLGRKLSKLRSIKRYIGASNHRVTDITRSCYRIPATIKGTRRSGQGTRPAISCRGSW